MLALFALAGCPDQQLNPVDNGNGTVVYEPDIEIEPDALSWEPTEPGVESVQSFTIANNGTIDLHLSNIVMQGTTAFVVGTDQATATIAPGSAITIPVTFSPANPDDIATVYVTSDDPDSPSLPVGLAGSGLIPQLFISPNPYGFGDVLVDCPQSQPLTMSNIGNATLTVDQIVSVAGGFELGTIDLPVVLEPGESAALDVGFLPTAVEEYGGEIWFTSDSLVESTIVTVSGSGTLDSDLVDEFWQGDGPWDRTDIFFYVDQSGSMGDDRENMTSNFITFVSMLEGLDLDWQMMISTIDSGCNNTGILTPETSNLESAFLEGVEGFAGRYTEAGLAITANAMSNTVSGKCNDGFLRDDSKTTLVLVSDEPDQSPDGWDTYVAEIQAYAPNAAITAIVGDVPSGCATADPGDGYYQAAGATQGAFLSICEQDWTAYFEAIATLSSSGRTNLFPLSSTPDPTTLLVTIDEVVSTSGWEYDEGGNAVVFDDDHLPESGAHLLVSYSILGDCRE